MTEVAKAYNKLVPTMNKLTETYKVKINDFHSNVEGFGFYAEKNSTEYVKVSIFYTTAGEEYFITKYKKNSKYGHDILNDIVLDKRHTTNFKEVETLVLELL